MKKRYESPVAELVEVACEDVILASIGDTSIGDTEFEEDGGFDNWDE